MMSDVPNGSMPDEEYFLVRLGDAVPELRRLIEEYMDGNRAIANVQIEAQSYGAGFVETASRDRKANELAMWAVRNAGAIAALPRLLALAKLGAAVEGMPVIAIYDLDTGGNGHLSVTPWYPVDAPRLGEIKEKLN